MSDLVEFDDLGFLDAHDLRAVFSQISESQFVEAMSGASPVLRAQILKKLPSAVAVRLEAELNTRGPVDPSAAVLAQQAVVEALCRLSRGGQVAFDAPGDMVA